MPLAPGYEKPLRVERSLLSVPASSERFFAKAAASAADTIMLDLEDSVAPAHKEAARAQCVQAVNGVDWGAKTLLVRVNGLDTPWAYRDLIAVAEACPRLDGVMVPKIQAPRDVHFVDTLLTQVELAVGRERPIGIEILIESALGMTQAEAIAASSPRLEGISFGPGDYAASIGNRSRRIGAPDPDYVIQPDAIQAGGAPPGAGHWGDVWHYPLARVAAACRAYDLRPLDGPFADYRDAEGFRGAARRARALGYEGKWCIHPTQIELAHEIFSPAAEDVQWARDLLATMEQAHRSGAGAVSVAGGMVDMANVRQAQRIVAKAGRMQR